ncbi:hypothetical protein GOODEAATRI_030544 [Goodea atripinnis]|uniref:Uncharacterized protein n=1 Tax=Goodea atripinnis TaxID=208336 RepID=A0ABV0MQ14_9TELE
MCWGGQFHDKLSILSVTVVGSPSGMRWSGGQGDWTHTSSLSFITPSRLTFLRLTSRPLRIQREHRLFLWESTHHKWPGCVRLEVQSTGSSSTHPQRRGQYHHQLSSAPAWSGCVIKAARTRCTSTTVSTTCDRSPKHSPPITRQSLCLSGIQHMGFT